MCGSTGSGFGMADGFGWVATGLCHPILTGFGFEGIGAESLGDGAECPDIGGSTQDFSFRLLNYQHRVGGPEGVSDGFPGVGIADPLAICYEPILVAPFG
jgi:hypothetical protein